VRWAAAGLRRWRGRQWELEARKEVKGGSAHTPRPGCAGSGGKQVTPYQLVKQMPKERMVLYFDEPLADTLSDKK